MWKASKAIVRFVYRFAPDEWFYAYILSGWAIRSEGCFDGNELWTTQLASCVTAIVEELLA